MVQALKTRRDRLRPRDHADQFNALKTTRTSRPSTASPNGWTELGVQHLRDRDRQDDQGRRPSTKALPDPAFRDALGYAIDKQKLVDSVLGGYGDARARPSPAVPYAAGTSSRDAAHVRHRRWPNQKLTPPATLDASGKRARQGRQADQPAPDLAGLRRRDYAKDAQFIVEWFGQVGITVTAAVTEEAHARSTDVTGPGRRRPRPTTTCSSGAGSATRIRTSLLDSSSDDAIGIRQRQLSTRTRTTTSCTSSSAPSRPSQAQGHPAEMQNLFYDEAPYHILYYDDKLHAYRTDKFAGWTNQPANGTPLFGYGSFGYTLLTDATAVPSPTPAPTGSATAGAPSPGSTAAPSGSGSGTSSGACRSCRSPS